MTHEKELQNRYEAIIRQLDAKYSWKLTAEQSADYADAVARYVAPLSTDQQIQTVVCNYHNDHQVVMALRNPTHPLHSDTWFEWMATSVKIIYQRRLVRNEDLAVEVEDIAQIARLELVRSLPSFRYASRFSTWFYQVIVQCLQRYLRDQGVQKRSASLEPLDDQLHSSEILGESNPAADRAEIRVLTDDVFAILSRSVGSRGAFIFHLHAFAGLRIEEISTQVKLSPSRVRVLLKQARSHLRTHPHIHAWMAGD